MNNVYFVNQAYHNKTTDTWSKGFVVKSDPNVDNEAAALQSYHAYLGAYGYGNNPDIDYVYCRFASASGIREPMEETWEAPPSASQSEQ